MSETVAGDTEHTPMITPSEVIEHIYCPRFTWFMNVQHIPQQEDQRYKVLKGREVHRRPGLPADAHVARDDGAGSYLVVAAQPHHRGVGHRGRVPPSGLPRPRARALTRCCGIAGCFFNCDRMNVLCSEHSGINEALLYQAKALATWRWWWPGRG